MKYFSYIIAVLFSAMMFFGFAQNVFAQSCTSNTQCVAPKTCVSGTCQAAGASSSSSGSTGSNSNTSGGKFGTGFLNQTNLIQGTPNSFIVNIINAVTGVLGVVLIAMLVYGGALYVTSAGNEDQVKTGKTTITYAIIGIVIVSAARIIAQFVIQSIAG